MVSTWSELVYLLIHTGLYWSMSVCTVSMACACGYYLHWVTLVSIWSELILVCSGLYCTIVVLTGLSLRSEQVQPISALTLTALFTPVWTELTCQQDRRQTDTRTGCDIEAANESSSVCPGECKCVPVFTWVDWVLYVSGIGNTAVVYLYIYCKYLLDVTEGDLDSECIK